jgi:hypothetical protein
LEEKWTLGAVSTRTIGGAPTEGVRLVEVIDACESGLDVVVTTDIDESTEGRAGGSSRRQPPNIARKSSVGILIELPSMIASA